mmetsp:Transcript_12832/g.18935  ORF Transcript_12832/g.18935 Transcript_12832/m.18935 type:complete len:207 (-) Transcript_12832:180-800(-)|eukprot:CAMPEP_0113940676 /NCGR_PEP_ID=MMETSP1339-20121228/6759_1 /TAXON_ID=94617 /ORGANISM="Fibrocapsa japonica" /LENGTH=206 /DNA_ID=CAMNT_0000944583 /DNA_START=8 /DNA_END=628 /DNA_ORIENTATION=- /assembly_acc=CAM_ASM_000762
MTPIIQCKNAFVFLLINLLVDHSIAQYGDHTAAYQLFKAVDNEDIPGIKAAAELPDFDINVQPDGTGQTAFMRAVLRGYSVEVIRTLKDLGTDISIPEMQGYTPLHGAGFQGRDEIANLLIVEYGLDPNDVHEDGYTPLHRACWGSQTRHAKTVEVMIQHGADPDKLICKEQPHGETKCEHPFDVTTNIHTKRVLRKYSKTLTDEL